jgi:hypothetical protein
MKNVSLREGRPTGANWGGGGVVGRLIERTGLSDDPLKLKMSQKEEGEEDYTFLQLMEVNV